MNSQLAKQSLASLIPMHLPSQKFQDYLLSLSAVSSPHSTRSLYEHLVGTYSILKGWECKEEVCRAGLFHSVYSTPDYLRDNGEVPARDELRKLIGKGAEALVFQFSKLGHRGILQMVEQAERIPNDFRTKSALLEICLANMLDQSPFLDHSFFSGLIERDRSLWKRSLPVVSPLAQLALSKLLAENPIQD